MNFIYKLRIALTMGSNSGGSRAVLLPINYSNGSHVQIANHAISTYEIVINVQAISILLLLSLNTLPDLLTK